MWNRTDADRSDRCILCKRRKSKCMPARGRRIDAFNKCQRCSVGNLDCNFETYSPNLLPTKTCSSYKSRENLLETEDSFQPGSQIEQQSFITATSDTANGVSDRVVVGDSELPSPASVLSQGLSQHVIADQSKRVLWPNILSRLREAFSLEPHPVPEERDMVAMQAVRPICFEIRNGET